MTGDPPALDETVRPAAERSGLLSGRTLDAAFTALAIWMTAGVAMDFRVHNEGITFAEEGFLTPSHLTFYSAFLAIAVLVGAATAANRRDGASWIGAVPPGYRVGVLGVFLFGLGGPADLLWHSTFGFERGVEALTSPTHLLLAVGAALFLTSPLRAAWRREGRELSLRKGTPALVSAAFLLTVVAFFSLYGNPLSVPVAAVGSEVWPGHGVLSLAAFVAAVVGLCLALVGRFDLPVGAFTIVLVPAGALVTYVSGTFALAPSVVVAGVVADVLYRTTRPSFDRAPALRLFAAAIPFAFAVAYFASTAIVWGIGWTVHVWVGAVAVAVLVGLLVSYAVRPHAGTRPAAARPSAGIPED